MGFGSMIHRSITGEVRKQDLINVKDHLFSDSTMEMNPDGTCDVFGTVDFSDCNLKSLTQITPRIKRISGSFSCSGNQLTDLKGAPKYVGDSFYCNHNQLTTLEGAPEHIGDSLYCQNNQLTSFEGGPKEVGISITCRNNSEKLNKENIKRFCNIKKEDNIYF